MAGWHQRLDTAVLFCLHIKPWFCTDMYKINCMINTNPEMASDREQWSVMVKKSTPHVDGRRKRQLWLINWFRRIHVSQVLWLWSAPLTSRRGTPLQRPYYTTSAIRRRRTTGPCITFSSLVSRRWSTYAAAQTVFVSHRPSANFRVILQEKLKPFRYGLHIICWFCAHWKL